MPGLLGAGYNKKDSNRKQITRQHSRRSSGIDIHQQHFLLTDSQLLGLMDVVDLR